MIMMDKKSCLFKWDILKEKPIVYYTPLDHNGHYLLLWTKGGKEKSEIVDSTSDASKLYSPIVRIKSLQKLCSLEMELLTDINQLN